MNANRITSSCAFISVEEKPLVFEKKRTVRSILYPHIVFRLLLSLLFCSFTTLAPSQPSQAPVDLGSTSGFTILAGFAVTNVPPCDIKGNIGLSPAAESYITGFSQTDATGYATSPQVTGKIYAADMADPTPIMLTTAKGDLTIAYNDAAGRTPIPDGPFLNPGSGNLAGLVLVPGLYKFTGEAIATTDFTLTGSATDVWIFQIASTLTVSNGVHVTLAGGAKASNIFWQVGTSAVLGTTVVFHGTIMADASITLQTGAKLKGRALAFSGTVALNGNTVITNDEEDNNTQADYKLIYKHCNVDLGNALHANNVVVTGAMDKSTIKIKTLKNGIPDGAVDKPGEYVYLHNWPQIPNMSIDGDLKKLYTNCPISVLNASNGFVKSITGKNTNVRRMHAKQIGAVKMNAVADATAVIPALETTAIYTTLFGETMKVSVTGIILEELITEQAVKYIKTASKHYKVKTAGTVEKRLSIAGIGDQFDVVADAFGNLNKTTMTNVVVAPSIESISSNGGSILPAAIMGDVEKISANGGVFTTTAKGKVLLAGNFKANNTVSNVALKALVAKNNKFNGDSAGGEIGFSSDANALTVSAPNMKTIYGYARVSGIFIAGADGTGNPNYTGTIKKIMTKAADGLTGEAHVLSTEKDIKFKPLQGAFFTVYTVAP